MSIYSRCILMVDWRYVCRHSLVGEWGGGEWVEGFTRRPPHTHVKVSLYSLRRTLSGHQKIWRFAVEKKKTLLSAENRTTVPLLSNPECLIIISFLDQLLWAAFLCLSSIAVGKFWVISLKMQREIFLGICTDHINSLYVKYFGVVYLTSVLEHLLRV